MHKHTTLYRKCHLSTNHEFVFFNRSTKPVLLNLCLWMNYEKLKQSGDTILAMSKFFALTEVQKNNFRIIHHSILNKKLNNEMLISLLKMFVQRLKDDFDGQNTFASYGILNSTHVDQLSLNLISGRIWICQNLINVLSSELINPQCSLDLLVMMDEYFSSKLTDLLDYYVDLTKILEEKPGNMNVMTSMLVRQILRFETHLKNQEQYDSEIDIGSLIKDTLYPPN